MEYRFISYQVQFHQFVLNLRKNYETLIKTPMLILGDGGRGQNINDREEVNVCRSLKVTSNGVPSIPIK